MADIRQYRKDKETAEVDYDDSGHDDYGRRIKQHRARIRVAIMGAGILCVLVIIIISIIKYNMNYGSYTVKASADINDSGYTRYLNFGGGFVRYSRDGISLYSYDGTRRWDRTYEINNPLTDVCGNYLAIADAGGSEIYLFNKDGYVAAVNTALPISQINVSSQGLVAAILTDGTASNINMYNQDGSKIYNIKTTVEGDGVPVSMSVSDDGSKLVVAYTAVKGQELATSVVFYNFDEVGQNEVERIVGGYDTYGNQLVSKVEFINSDTVAAFGENIISFFRINEYPKQLKDIDIDYRIRKIFYSGSYVGVCHSTDNGTTVDVYDTSGNTVMTREVSDDYNNFDFGESTLVMYGADKCSIVNMKGKEIFQYDFEDDIIDLIPLDGNTGFLYHSSGRMQQIVLKHGG